MKCFKLICIIVSVQAPPWNNRETTLKQIRSLFHVLSYRWTDPKIKHETFSVLSCFISALDEGLNAIVLYYWPTKQKKQWCVYFIEFYSRPCENCVKSTVNYFYSIIEFLFYKNSILILYCNSTEYTNSAYCSIDQISFYRAVHIYISQGHIVV